MGGEISICRAKHNFLVRDPLSCTRCVCVYRSAQGGKLAIGDTNAHVHDGDNICSLSLFFSFKRRKSVLEQAPLLRTNDYTLSKIIYLTPTIRADPHK